MNFMGSVTIAALIVTAIAQQANAQHYEYESGPGGTPPAAYQYLNPPPQPSTSSSDDDRRAPLFPSDLPTAQQRWSYRPPAEPQQERQSTIPEPPPAFGDQ
jgi:hypothetical protein